MAATRVRGLLSWKNPGYLRNSKAFVRDVARREDVWYEQALRVELALLGDEALAGISLDYAK